MTAEEFLQRIYDLESDIACKEDEIRKIHEDMIHLKSVDTGKDRVDGGQPMDLSDFDGYVLFYCLEAGQHGVCEHIHMTSMDQPTGHSVEACPRHSAIGRPPPGPSRYYWAGKRCGSASPEERLRQNRKIGLTV